MTAINLQAAYLCECGMIGDNANRCVCGNRLGLLNLANVLEREYVETPHRVKALIETLDAALEV